MKKIWVLEDVFPTDVLEEFLAWMPGLTIASALVSVGFVSLALASPPYYYPSYPWQLFPSRASYAVFVAAVRVSIAARSFSPAGFAIRRGLWGLWGPSGEGVAAEVVAQCRLGVEHWRHSGLEPFAYR